MKNLHFVIGLAIAVLCLGACVVIMIYTAVKSRGKKRDGEATKEP